MMTETLRLFQCDARNVSRLVKATEFRTSSGNKYTVTIISDRGHDTVPVGSRGEAIECADNYIGQFTAELARAYNLFA